MSTTSSAFIPSLPAEGALGHSCSTERGSEHKPGDRRAVSRAISALRLTPVLFELRARPHPPRDVYRAYLAQSDVFIGL